MVSAHSGGTDSNGGHNCYTSECYGEYHYHNSGRPSSGSSSSYTPQVTTPFWSPLFENDEEFYEWLFSRDHARDPGLRWASTTTEPYYSYGQNSAQERFDRLLGRSENEFQRETYIPQAGGSPLIPATTDPDPFDTPWTTEPESGLTAWEEMQKAMEEARAEAAEMPTLVPTPRSSSEESNEDSNSDFYKGLLGLLAGLLIVGVYELRERKTGR